MTNPFTRALDAELRGARVRVTSSEGTFVGWVERMHHQQRHVLLRAASRVDGDGEIVEAMGSTFVAHAETIETIDPVEIQAIPLDQLEPAPYAAREFDPLQNGAYISQVRDEGWVGSYPTVRYVDGTHYEILEGHKRIWVAEQAGLASHPVQIADDISDWEAARWFVDDHFPDPEQVDGEETTADGYYGAAEIEAATEALVSKWGEQAFDLERVSWNAARLGLDVLNETEEPAQPGSPVAAVNRIADGPVTPEQYAVSRGDGDELVSAVTPVDGIDYLTTGEPETYTLPDGVDSAAESENGSGYESSRPSRERVIEALRERGEMTSGELTEVLDGDHNELYRTLPELQEEGIVESQRDPNDGRRKLHRLADPGEFHVGDELDDDIDETSDSGPPEDEAAAAIQSRLPEDVDVDDVEAARQSSNKLEKIADELGMPVDATRSVLYLTDNYSGVHEGAKFRGGA